MVVGATDSAGTGLGATEPLVAEAGGVGLGAVEPAEAVTREGRRIVGSEPGGAGDRDVVALVVTEIGMWAGGGACVAVGARAGARPVRIGAATGAGATGAGATGAAPVVESAGAVVGVGVGVGVDNDRVGGACAAVVAWAGADMTMVLEVVKVIAIADSTSRRVSAGENRHALRQRRDQLAPRHKTVPVTSQAVRMPATRRPVTAKAVSADVCDNQSPRSWRGSANSSMRPAAMTPTTAATSSTRSATSWRRARVRPKSVLLAASDCVGGRGCNCYPSRNAFRFLHRYASSGESSASVDKRYIK